MSSAADTADTAAAPCDAPLLLSSLEDDVETHVPFKHMRDWKEIRYDELYSGMRLLFHSYGTFWYAAIIFVGKYPVARDDDVAFVFVERNTGKPYMFLLPKSEVHGGGTVYISRLYQLYRNDAFPLLPAELEDDGALAKNAASRLCLQTSSGATGFVTPFALPLRGACVRLPRLMMSRLLRIDNNTHTFFVATKDTRGVIAFKPNATKSARNLEKDGVFALFAPLQIKPTTRLHITPHELDTRLSSDAVYIYTTSFNSDTPQASIASFDLGPPIDCSRLYEKEVGDSFVLQLEKKDTFVFKCRFVGLGRSIAGRLMVVAHVKGTDPDMLHSVPCDTIYKMWDQVKFARAVFTKFKTFSLYDDFAAAPSVPTAYEPTRPDALATRFLALATVRDCTTDAWVQREGTCWATSILNMITLTPSLRHYFMHAVITPQPLNPAWHAAKAIQDAITCRSSPDAPFCAFTGPEMVCTLLREGLTTGARPVHNLVRLCEAADIPLHFEWTSREPVDKRTRFNLVLTNEIKNDKNTRIWEPRDRGWDIETHAAAAIMIFNNHDGATHAIAGIRCPTGDPFTPAKYLLIDETILSSPDWLHIVWGRQFRMNQLETWLAYPGLRSVFLFVLFDFGVTFPTSSLTAIDTE